MLTTAEESAAASEELSNQAEIMSDLIKQFKLNEKEMKRKRENDISIKLVSENMKEPVINKKVISIGTEYGKY